MKNDDDKISTGLFKHQFHQICDQIMVVALEQGWSIEEGLTLIEQMLKKAAKAMPPDAIATMSEAEFMAQWERCYDAAFEEIMKARIVQFHPPP